MARGSMFRLLCRCYSGCYYRHLIGLSPTTASLLWRDKHEDIKRSFRTFPPDCTLSLSHCGASNTLFRNLTVNRIVYTTFRSFSFFSSSDTVFALSSGHGKCGVAVIRATGPHAEEALLKLTKRASLPRPRQAVFTPLYDPRTGDTIDHSLVLWFPGPHSFTGEDSVEFQTHGGPAVVLAVLEALSRVPGCRHAEPGDFTKRAFFNGKLDLTEVEGLADLIHAETEAQRKQALRQMEGDLSGLYHKWSKELIQCVAHVEAVIDFGEDENIEDGLLPRVREQVEDLLKEVDAHLSDGRRGERLRSGVHVTIIGAPNAGKSSLLNILCQRPTAIVSPSAGTTRDVLESALDIHGYPIVISDTAGLRDSSDPIEQEGVKRALKKAESADLKILIADASLHVDLLTPPSYTSAASPTDLRCLASQLLISGDGSSAHTLTESLVSTDVFDRDGTVIVMNKTDLLSPESVEMFKETVEEVPVCWMSCKTGNGVDEFMDTMKKVLEQMCGNPLAGNPSLTQARHRQNLSLCSENLQRFLNLTSVPEEADRVLDLAAEELRAAIGNIGRITGKVGIEDILDVVFKDFCIGK